MIFEIKSDTSLKKALRGKGLDQLQRHVDNFKLATRTQVTALFLKTCLALPEYPVTIKAGQESALMRDLDGRMDTEHEKRAMDSSRDSTKTVSLCRLTLEDEERLQLWLQVRHLISKFHSCQTMKMLHITVAGSDFDQIVY